MSIVEKMQKDAELQALRAEVERLKSFEELYKAGCTAWNPTFKTILDERDALRAEVERLDKSRNKWGKKYNKLLEKHKVMLSQLKTAVWSDSEECKLLSAEVERLREVLDLYREAVRIDVTMEGPQFMGSNASALKRAWDADRAALEEKP